MIKKIKASASERFILILLILLGITTFGTYFVIKNECIFVKNFNPKKINFKKPNNIKKIKMNFSDLEALIFFII